MKVLEAKNAHLEKRYAEEGLKADILRCGVTSSPAILAMRNGQGIGSHKGSIRLTYEIFSLSQTCYCYVSKRNAEINDHRLAAAPGGQPSHWVFGLYFPYLRNAMDLGWNHKRVYWVYRELNLRIKPRKRLVREHPNPLAVPEAANHICSMNSMHD